LRVSQVLGANVKWLRQRAGLSQAELAARVRLRRKATTGSYISRVESGQIDPPLSFVQSLARALNVRPYMLLLDLTESRSFWDHYLALSPAKKRQVQQLVQYLYNLRP